MKTISPRSGLGNSSSEGANFFVTGSPTATRIASKARGERIRLMGGITTMTYIDARRRGLSLATRKTRCQTGFRFGFRGCGIRLDFDALRVRVDVEVVLAEEPDEGDAKFAGELDREARGRRHRA